MKNVFCLMINEGGDNCVMVFENLKKIEEWLRGEEVGIEKLIRKDGKECEIMKELEELSSSEKMREYVNEELCEMGDDWVDMRIRVGVIMD